MRNKPQQQRVRFCEVLEEYVFLNKEDSTRKEGLCK